MAIRSILVPVDGSPASIDTLNMAVIVASRFGAHLDALHIVHSSMEPVYSHLSDRIPSSMRQSLTDQAMDAAREHADEVKAQFEKFCQEHGVEISNKPSGEVTVSASWTEVIRNDVAQTLIRRGLLSDVVVVSRPNEDKSKIRRSPVGENLEAIMMGTGRPVLIVPPKCDCAPAKHIAIGWNESQEASRALSQSMPWLSQMEKVTIMVSKKREERVTRVVDYLAWHGIDNVDVVLLDGKGKSVGQGMLNICEEVGADVLTVGGFSHSRARELLFGGVTRHLLSHATIPILMVH